MTSRMSASCSLRLRLIMWSTSFFADLAHGRLASSPSQLGPGGWEPRIGPGARDDRGAGKVGLHVEYPVAGPAAGGKGREGCLFEQGRQ